MSYSRWTHSVWYTYWDTSSGDTLEEQVFTVCELDGSLHFTFKDLKEDRQGCLAKVRCKGDFTEAEINELNSYMDEFTSDMEDMENKFNENKIR